MREPPITITCDCGALGYVPYGERWQCEKCGKTWDTSQIPRAEFDSLLAGVGPPLVLAAVLIPLAVLVGLQYAFLLFVLVMAYGLLVVPQIRRRTKAASSASSTAWKLSPE